MASNSTLLSGPTNVLIGRFAWTASNIHEQLINFTCKICNENRVLVAHGMLNVSLDNDTAYARATFHTHKLAVLFIREFNAREATNFPDTFVQIVTM